MHIVAPCVGDMRNIPKTFFAGDYIDASVLIIVQEPFIDVRTIWVYFSGKATHNNIKLASFVKERFELIKPENIQQRTRLLRGRHLYPFRIFIPKSCPTTITEGHCTITYQIKSVCDVVYLEDLKANHPVHVVNVEHLCEGKEGKALDVTQSKAAGGGKVTFTVTMDRDYIQPYEDFVVTIDVNNQSMKDIKETDIKLQIKTKVQNQKLVLWDSIKTWKKKFRPRKVFPRSTLKQQFILEVPGDICHSFKRGALVSIKYQLRVELSIPGEMDLFVLVPIRVFRAHPKVPLMRIIHNPLLELQKLPGMQYNPETKEYVLIDNSGWSDMQMGAWLLCSYNNIALYEFINTYRLTKSELAYLARYELTPFGELIQQELMKDFYKKFKGKVVRTIDPLIKDMLFELGLYNYLEPFLSNRITFDVLPSMTKRDFQNMDLPLGDIYRILLWIKARCDPNMPKVIDNTYLEQTTIMNKK